jgi:conjugal transfer pilin signal peptidase TrbI
MDKNKFRKNILALLLVAVTAVGIVELATIKYSLLVTRANHKCLPWNFLYLKKDVIPKERGDLIAFRGEDIPYFEDGIRFTKMIVGLPGDVIKVRMYSEKERKRSKQKTEKDGELITIRMQGKVSLFKQGQGDPVSFEVIEKDSIGRELPIIKSMVIPDGKYFVAGTFKRTFDSRYWGLVDERQVIGQAFPLAFWKSTKGYI